MMNLEERLQNLIGEEVDAADYEMTIEALLYEKCNIVSEQGADGWEGKKTYDAIYNVSDKDYGYQITVNNCFYSIVINDESVIVKVA